MKPLLPKRRLYWNETEFANAGSRYGLPTVTYRGSEKARGGVEVAAVRARYAARIRGLQLVVIPEFVHEYQRRIHREIIPVDYYVIVFDVGYFAAVALDAKALGFVNRFFSAQSTCAVKLPE